ncbi:hypothetical protein OCK02_10570 [Rhizobium sp. TRM96647]|uniref:hypothetical protein n=1 Tax=unclassified Rhizobium TaxID=2613769 RepID=UPI0021E74363|nr:MULTISPECIES: hypothetical protein [unclassified Rhizobium]MCV3736649.1 hypothetical protein [Rhizobium sp. TRM96647]MCV3759018.1 hypothetical protein [Rhizobium sp. TRM96650]
MDNRCFYTIDTVASVARTELLPNMQVSEGIYAGPAQKEGAAIAIERLATSTRLHLLFAASEGGSIAFRLPIQAFASHQFAGLHFRAKCDQRVVVLPSLYALENGIVRAKVKMRGMAVDLKSWSFTEAAHFPHEINGSAEYFLELEIPAKDVVLDIETMMLW